MSRSSHPPHVLHLGSGVRPFRRGGLVAYVEDLTAEQARRGARTSYLYAGRYFRWPREPRLKRWQRDGISMFEILNSPLFDHGRQPELELDEPGIERIFARLLVELQPDVVHVQELAGLPSSLLTIAKQADFPVVMTLQDYFPVCPTFKLFDCDARVCHRQELGNECIAALRSPDRRPNLLLEASMRRELDRRLPERPRKGRHRLIERLAVSPLTATADPDSPLPPLATFQRRREVNVGRMNQLDRVIAMSDRVAELFCDLGVEAERMTTMQLTLSHIEQLTPRQPRESEHLTFATLGGGESVAKGSRVMLDAARCLAPDLAAGHLRLIVFGHLEPGFEAAAAEIKGLEIGRTFRPSELDRILDEVDVGIMPSVWEEAYGYAGMEFLAKGIPVVSNKIGGMTDYVLPGVSGWLNEDCDGQGIARILGGLRAEPERVTRMSENALAARDQLITPMNRHVDELGALYATLTGAPAASN